MNQSQMEKGINSPEQIDPNTQEGKLLRLTQIDERVREIKAEITKLVTDLKQLTDTEGPDAINNQEEDGRTVKERVNFILDQRKEEAKKLREEKERIVQQLDEEYAKEKESTTLEQDLTDLTKVEIFTLDIKPINPKQVLEKKEATDTQAGVYTWVNFDNWIRPNIQDTTLTPESIPITSFTLDINMKGEELKKKLGKAKPFTIDQFATLINNQSEISGNTPKVTSPLDTSGRANLFLVEKADGSIVVVNAYWDSDNRKWDVNASGLANGWNDGNRVFSRND